MIMQEYTWTKRTSCVCYPNEINSWRQSVNKNVSRAAIIATGA